MKSVNLEIINLESVNPEILRQENEYRVIRGERTAVGKKGEK